MLEVAQHRALCGKLCFMHAARPFASLKRFFRAGTAAFLLSAVATAVSAHEFWLHATPFSPATGGYSDISLHVGEFFVGELVGVTTAHASSIKLVNSDGTQNVTSLAPTGSMLRSLRLTLTRPGAHVLVYDSHPSNVTLSAEKFHEYLNEEGLAAVIRQRESANTAATEGRERFRRNAKLILKVGSRDDATAMAATGQKLEIVPLSNPLQATAGQVLGFEVRWDARALPGILVKAWHGRAGQTVVIRTVTDRQGRVSVNLPHGGAWMLSAVHMIPVTGEPGLDWDSFWSSLSFELADRPR